MYRVRWNMIETKRYAQKRATLMKEKQAKKWRAQLARNALLVKPLEICNTTSKNITKGIRKQENKPKTSRNFQKIRSNRREREGRWTSCQRLAQAGSSASEVSENLLDYATSGCAPHLHPSRAPHQTKGTQVEVPDGGCRLGFSVGSTGSGAKEEARGGKVDAGEKAGGGGVYMK
ncbi:unnamed protein product [Musa hybrid cultivar]